MIIDVFQIYIRLWVRFAVAVFSKMLRSDLSKSRDPVSSGGNGCIFAEANGGPYLYEQADSWFSWDFLWFSSTEKSLSPYQGFGSVISRKPFVREQKTSLFFEFWMKKFGYLWDLAGFIHSHVCKRSLPAASSRAFLPLRHWVSETWSFLFCSFLPKDENRIRRRHPWDRIKRCRRSFRHNQIHYKIQRVCIVSGHWFEMVDDGSVAVWWYL